MVNVDAALKKASGGEVEVEEKENERVGAPSRAAPAACGTRPDMREKRETVEITEEHTMQGLPWARVIPRGQSASEGRAQRAAQGEQARASKRTRHRTRGLGTQAVIGRLTLM